MKNVAGIARAVPVLAMIISAAGAAPAAAAPGMTLSCGSVVTESVKLANDVGPCPDDGLVIAASGITLDLNGHRVKGTFDPLAMGAPPDDEGITFRMVKGSTLRNGEVTGFATGVKIDGGSGNRVTRMDVHDNRGRSSAGDGIVVFGSQRNRVDHNRVVGNGPASGITLLAAQSAGSPGSSYNEISDNLVLDNNIPEVGADGTPNWRRDIGIAIEGPGATHNRVLRNLVENSGTHGIQVFPACSTGYDVSTGCPGTVGNDYNVIRNNRVNGNGLAAPTEGMPLGDGISILSMGPAMVKMPRGTVVENNTTDGNQRNGISLGGGNGQELATGTWTTGGESYGCYRPQRGDPNDPIVDSPDLCGVNGNTVVRNSASGNGAAGIYVGPRSDENTISYNRATNNGSDGIAIGLAVRYDEDQREVRDASGNLVTIAGSGGRNNTLEHNRATGNNRWDGADENPGCDNNRWVRNRFGTVNQACVR